MSAQKETSFWLSGTTATTFR